MRKQLLKVIHEKNAGNLGAEKTQSQLKRRGYWYNWRRDVKLFCSDCVPCNTYHRGAVPKQGHLQAMRVGEPMQRLQIDITGFHPLSDNGMIYILTAICAFTKFAVAVPLPDKSATTVAHALIENVILKLGCPASIHSDFGREFENSLMRQICDELGVEKTHTTPYHSRGNGCVERWHRSLNAMLGKTVATHQTDWPTHLPFVVNAYNTTEHSATGFSPFFLMYGREQNTPIDVVLGDTRPSGQQVGNYAQLLVDRMRQAHALARENLKRTAERVKKYYDVGVRHKQFNEGDRVWMLNPRRFKKKSPKWERPYVGPFTVVKKINDVNYLITRGAGSSAIVTHVDKLKRYANVMCLFRREKMPFSCPRCAYQTDVYANIRRHAFSQHRAYWRGPEHTLEPVPPHELSEVAERHRLRQRNSRQRRRDRD